MREFERRYRAPPSRRFASNALKTFMNAYAVHLALERSATGSGGTLQLVLTLSHPCYIVHTIRRRVHHA